MSDGVMALVFNPHPHCDPPPRPSPPTTPNLHLQVLAHGSVTEAIMVELDPDMVDVAKRHLGQFHNCSFVAAAHHEPFSCFDDPRATLVIEDAFVILTWALTISHVLLSLNAAPRTTVYHGHLGVRIYYLLHADLVLAIRCCADIYSQTWFRRTFPVGGACGSANPKAFDVIILDLLDPELIPDVEFARQL